MADTKDIEDPVRNAVRAEIRRAISLPAGPPIPPENGVTHNGVQITHKGLFVTHG